MLDISIRNKREKLRLESIRLRELIIEQDDFNYDLYLKQDEIYKKWLFYDKFIKVMEDLEK